MDVCEFVDKLVLLLFFENKHLCQNYDRMLMYVNVVLPYT